MDRLARLNKKSRKQARYRVGLICVAIVATLIVFFFIFNSTKASGASSFTLNSSSQNVSNPLDQVSSANIALTVADLDNLPETTAVANQAQSASADVAMSEISNNVVQKPQVVSTALKTNADIQTYVAQNGDTVASVATKFNITPNSILWSNGLSGNALTAGLKLIIPPVNGVVYTVQTGDTPSSLASRFSADANQIISYNNAEITGLIPGQEIIIPNGTMAAKTSYSGQDLENGSGSVSSVSFPWGSGPIYGTNGYDFGYCTWYVATQIPVPSNWGNAATWAYYAGLSGWNVSTTPSVGAIAQTPYAAGGEGHVAIVDAVSSDGSQIQIRDMNGIAGWDRVGYSGWIPTSTFVHYITR